MANQFTITKGKQERRSFALLFEAAETEHELIGKGIEEIAIEQGADVESKKDVTGSTNTELSGYEKTTALDPIYIAGGVKFSELLDDIEENELIGDDVVHPFIWVKTYKTDSTGKCAAWRQNAVIELTSFGGGIKGVNAPCTLHWIGEREHGTYDPATKKFTPLTSAAQASLPADTTDE